MIHGLSSPSAWASATIILAGGIPQGHMPPPLCPSRPPRASPPPTSCCSSPGPAPAQVLSVVLLKGKMHYCRSEGADRGDALDPYYLVAAGESINKTWCACPWLGVGALLGARIRTMVRDRLWRVSRMKGSSTHLDPYYPWCLAWQGQQIELGARIQTMVRDRLGVCTGQ